MYRHTNTIVNDGPESLIPEVYFHPDGSLLAVPFRDANEVRLLDAKTMAVHRLYRNPEAMLDMPHAVMMTHDHLIAASRHQLERPATFTVYRLSDDSSAPIVTFETPVDHLRECHSLDIRGSILVGTYTLSADCIGAAVSYYFDHDSGEIRGPIDSLQDIFNSLGEPKGISYAPDGRQVFISFNAEKFPHGLEKLAVYLFKARNLVAKSGPRALFNKIREGKNPLYAGATGRHNGIAVFDIDEQGHFSPEPARVMLREEFCRLENIDINGDTAALADTINNQVHLFNLPTDPQLENPIYTISQGLAQPHGVKLSPDKSQLVVTNFGLLSYRQMVHWGHHCNPRRDNVMVFQRSDY
jgi:hypothetical protein